MTKSAAVTVLIRNLRTRNQEADKREELPTASIMCSYQDPMFVVCIKSIKVSVQVMLRMTPKTDKSARSGFAPPWNLQVHNSFMSP